MPRNKMAAEYLITKPTGVSCFVVSTLCGGHRLLYRTAYCVLRPSERCGGGAADRAAAALEYGADELGAARVLFGLCGFSDSFRNACAASGSLSYFVLQRGGMVATDCSDADSTDAGRYVCCAVTAGYFRKREFPCMNSLLATWLPRHEYARAAGFCWSGAMPAPSLHFLSPFDHLKTSVTIRGLELIRQGVPIHLESVEDSELLLFETATN